MPKLFKALASIGVWVLFIVGVASLLTTWIQVLTRSGGIDGEPYNFSDVVWESEAVVTLFLAVVAMKIRKGLE